MEARRLASLGDLSDETLWEMSRNPTFIEAGKESLPWAEGTCVTCHGANLEGRHRSESRRWRMEMGQPSRSAFTPSIAEGSPDKSSGMQAWMQQLGPKR
jgi:mono/diheme cytochrome c family protein